MLTSPSNDRVKRICELEKKARARKKEGVFVLEGLRVVQEIPTESLLELYVSQSFYENVDHATVCDALSKSAGIELTFTSDDVMKKMADTDHPQGILAVAKIPEHEMEELFSSSPLILICEDIQDPGNLGTIFRTAEGAGATGILLSAGTCDPTQPKVVRSTMGSIFRMPYVRVNSDEEWYPILRGLQQSGVKLYAAWLQGSVPYDEPDYSAGSAFLIGNEGNGLREETAELSDQKIRIPMGGKLESLNAAMSAGILMYEAARQRRLTP